MCLSGGEYSDGVQGRGRKRRLFSAFRSLWIALIFVASVILFDLLGAIALGCGTRLRSEHVRCPWSDERNEARRVHGAYSELRGTMQRPAATGRNISLYFTPLRKQKHAIVTAIIERIVVEMGQKLNITEKVAIINYPEITMKKFEETDCRYCERYFTFNLLVCTHAELEIEIILQSRLGIRKNN